MIKVIKSGIMCSVQDAGRFGYRHMGVPVSGWMDDISAKKANLILHNKEDHAVIEIGPLGPVLSFEYDTVICLTGAPKTALLNDASVPFYKSIIVKSGDILSLKSGNKGVWTYIAVKNGIQTDKILNSRSSYYGLANIGLTMTKGAVSPYFPYSEDATQITHSRLSFNPELVEFKVHQGSEWHLLSEDQKAIFMTNSFQIGSKSDRMGYYLNTGHADALAQVSGIITGPVSPGTIQLPSSGIPMVLMKDAQTTGGYARVLQVDKYDLASLSQVRSGEEVRFRMGKK